MEILSECNLSASELDAVSGAADGCYYGGQLYSLGSVVSMGNGSFGTCSRNTSTGSYYWAT